MSINAELYKSLLEIVNNYQTDKATQLELQNEFQQLYNESIFDEFFHEFNLIIQKIITTTTIKNVNIERLINFTIQLLNSLLKPTQQQNIDSTLIRNNKSNSATNNLNGVNIFHMRLISCLLNYQRAKLDTIRYRCCHILSKIICVINQEQLIEEKLFDKLCDAMLERLKDNNFKVQIEAIKTIHRFQNPHDRNCKIIKALLFQLSTNSNWQVRYQALSHIEYSLETLPIIIDRVLCDLHANCRQKALLILSDKVVAKYISNENRMLVLRHSLNDNDQIVVDTCYKKLLPSWMAFMENNIIKLLKLLDVVKSRQTVELMLEKMFAEEDLSVLCKNFDLINEKHLIDLNKLDAESVTYWKWLCENCKKSNDNESLRLILPHSLVDFCDYVKNAYEKLTVINTAPRQYIIEQLVKMVMCYNAPIKNDMKILASLCHSLFSDKNNSLIFDCVMSVYKLAVSNLKNRISNLVNIIINLKSISEAQYEKYDSIHLLNIHHCLQLSDCLLQDPEITCLTPKLRELYNLLIIPNLFCSVNMDIKVTSVRVLARIGLLKIDMIQKYVPLLLTMIKYDQKEIKIEAFNGFINCILKYSLREMVNHFDDNDSTETMCVLTSLLDSKETDICVCAANGFCKLFSTGHVSSEKIFSKLIIIYHNPLTENQNKLRECLANFLPQFAFSTSINQLCVEESFMITIDSLINASPDSDLSKIDIIKMAQHLLDLTNPKNLRKQRIRSNERQVNNNVCHENIGRSICNKILHDDNDTFKNGIYLKIINMIDLSLADDFTLRQFKSLATDIEEHVVDKLLKKSAKMFSESISKLITTVNERKKNMMEEWSNETKIEDKKIEIKNNFKVAEEEVVSISEHQRTRARKRSLSPFDEIDENENKRVKRFSVNIFQTPKSAENKLKLKTPKQQVLIEENNDSDSDIDVIAIVEPKKRSYVRTQSTSPCESGESSSKMRRSMFIPKRSNTKK